MSAISAVYIYDEHNSLLFNHVYTGKPPAPSVVLPLYLQHESPRPSVIYRTSINPPTVLFSIIQDNLLFLSPAASDVEPLLVLEFLHRVADACEEFLGSPLIATKLSANYDILAQIVAEMADSGVVCQGEPSALRDVVETGPGVLKNLLGGVGLPGSSPNLQSIGSGALARPSLSPAQSSQGSAVPWRRSNVVHSNNEMYVDIVETLQVILAPSGRPLSAFANGSIAFNSKLSGVPDLVLSLSTGGKGAGMGTRGDQLRNVMERVVFHPCVRLAKWRSEGILSFVPPDGRFALCGYEADLLGPDVKIDTTKSASNSLNLPATVEITTGLGPSGADFEVRAKQNSASFSPAAASLQLNLGSGRPGAAFRNAAAPTGQSGAPALEDLTIHIPLPSSVRNLSDMRPSKGESRWDPIDGSVEWRISAKDLGPGGAVLRCTVLGPLSNDNQDSSTAVVNRMTATTYDYDEEPSGHQGQGRHGPKSNGHDTAQATDRNRELMPSSATLSFAVKGWLASGLKVESLVLDTKKSRGVLQGMKPYKGVKYITVSRRGVEMRC